MPDHYTKWKLNKSEQAKVDKDYKALLQQLEDAGETSEGAESKAAAQRDAQVKARSVISCRLGAGAQRSEDAAEPAEEGHRGPARRRRDEQDQPEDAGGLPEESGLLRVFDGGHEHDPEDPDVLQHPGC